LGAVRIWRFGVLLRPGSAADRISSKACALRTEKVLAEAAHYVARSFSKRFSGPVRIDHRGQPRCYISLMRTKKPPQRELRRFEKNLNQRLVATAAQHDGGQCEATADECEGTGLGNSDSHIGV